MTTLAAGTKLDGPSGAGTLVVDQRIGGGRFGHVHVATDSVTARRVAVKFPQSAVLDSAELVAFKNDLLAAGKVKHPNVVQVLWGSPDSDPPYVVMEYADGGTLKDELDRRRRAKEMLKPDEVRRWLEHVLDGIEAISARSSRCFKRASSSGRRLDRICTISTGAQHSCWSAACVPHRRSSLTIADGDGRLVTTERSSQPRTNTGLDVWMELNGERLPLTDKEFPVACMVGTYKAPTP